MNVAVGNTVFRNLASNLVFYEYSPSKTLIEHECSNQHKPMVCDFKIREVKDTRRKFVYSRKIWKLNMKALLRVISAHKSTRTERVV